MSLLIKALEKAEKGQAEKTRQGKTQAEKGQEKQSQAQPNAKKRQATELAIAESDTEIALSLSPAQEVAIQKNSLPEVGFEALEFEADLIPASMRESAVSKGAAGISVANISAANINKAESADKPTYTKTILETNQQAKPHLRTPSPLDPRAKDSTHTQAASVFTAKRAEATHQNAKLAMIAGAGLIAMLAMGVYYYQFVDSTPDVQMPPIRPPQIAVAPVEPVPLPPESLPESVPLQEVEATPVPDVTEAFEPKELPLENKQSNKQIKKQNKAQAQTGNDEIADIAESLAPNEAAVSVRKNNNKSSMVKMDKVIASDSASIQVSQSKPQDAVNPLVMRAYEAYNAGNDSDAQKLYKQALQRDSTNVDAMLGLGAIATRQGRAADANGWYRKVLGLEPRNSTALAASADTQQLDDPQANESRIKSMLAKSPNDAGLHAALGNLYAEQNQWRAAQEAYFEAFRLNDSPENAFNLGVSLDQIGKPKLALPYYQQALQMAEQSGANGIDKTALQDRINAIQ